MAVGVHDWTKVKAGIFHDFHHRWITYLTDALNTGPLPKGYFARAEQHYWEHQPDVLTLRSGRSDPGGPTRGGPRGGVAVADAPPQVSRQVVMQPPPKTWQRTVSVRREGADELVAVIEIVSPANKDRPRTAETFIGKVAGTLASGVHVVVIDLFPQGRRMPGGWHPLLNRELDIPKGRGGNGEDQPSDRPVALLSYEAAMPHIMAYLEYVKVGDPLPDMPLFLTTGRYVNAPLAATYEATYRPLPPETKEMLDTPPPGRRGRGRRGG